jgi:hypothetical protein
LKRLTIGKASFLSEIQIAVTLMLMAVTGSLRGFEASLLEQVEKIIASPVLHGSDALCRLLRFLATESLENPGIPIKEYRIATELFGRPAEFDPKFDSTVRVQTGRLRSKLAEYYGTRGAQDDLVLEIPKGSYLLSLHHRRPSVPESPPTLTAADQVLSAPKRLKARVPWWWFATSVALAVGLAGIAIRQSVKVETLIGDQASLLRIENIQQRDVSTLRHFWGIFTKQTDSPIVVYSNAEFVGRPETGMRYFQPTDSKEAILDHYTGFGEVVAVHELDSVFTALRWPLRIKRGRLLTFDDAQNSDLIFVGSPSENLSLRDLPSTKEFAFALSKEPGRAGDLLIENLHPESGEPGAFLANPGMPVVLDYAVVGLLQNDRRDVLVLAGTTTLGTQAAAEFVCNPSRLRELTTRVAGAPERDIQPFEAVLRVKVSQGVPVQSQVVALRTRKDTGSR